MDAAVFNVIDLVHVKEPVSCLHAPTTAAPHTTLPQFTPRPRGTHRSVAPHMTRPLESTGERTKLHRITVVDLPWSSFVPGRADETSSVDICDECPSGKPTSRSTTVHIRAAQSRNGHVRRVNDTDPQKSEGRWGADFHQQRPHPTSSAHLTPESLTALDQNPPRCPEAIQKGQRRAQGRVKGHIRLPVLGEIAAVEQNVHLGPRLSLRSATGQREAEGTKDTWSRAGRGGAEQRTGGWRHVPATLRLTGGSMRCPRSKWANSSCLG